MITLIQKYIAAKGATTSSKPIIESVYFLAGNCCSDINEEPLTINSSIPDISGNGTLDFFGGEPGEIITMSFILFTGTPVVNPDPSPNIVNFNPPVQVAVLDESHTSRTGTVTLDINGEASGVYNIQGSYTCIVTITSRGSSEPIPTNNSTQIQIL